MRRSSPGRKVHGNRPMNPDSGCPRAGWFPGWEAVKSALAPCSLTHCSASSASPPWGRRPQWLLRAPRMHGAQHPRLSVRPPSFERSPPLVMLMTTLAILLIDQPVHFDRSAKRMREVVPRRWDGISVTAHTPINLTLQSSIASGNQGFGQPNHGPTQACQVERREWSPTI